MPGERLRIISTVEMEIRNPIEGYFGSEFLAVCNLCGYVSLKSQYV